MLVNTFIAGDFMETTTHSVKNIFGNFVNVPADLSIEVEKGFVAVKYIRDQDSQLWRPEAIYLDRQEEMG